MSADRAGRHAVVILAVLAGMVLCLPQAMATVVYIEATSNTVPMAVTGTTSFSGWGTIDSYWTAVTALNDPSDSGVSDNWDLVGDANAPAFYYAFRDGYLYTRMRLDYDGDISTGTVLNVLSGTHFVLINIDGDAEPDYAFGLDSKQTITNHGLEMNVYASGAGSTWSALRMGDYDQNTSGSSRPQAEINGAENGTYRTTDGYVRITDNVVTTTFGDTLLIDFALRWGYLTGVDQAALGPPLSYPDQPALTSTVTWGFQLGTIIQANDHNAIDGDIAGGYSPSSTVTTGSYATVARVPEPGAALLAACGACLLALYRAPRRRSA